MPVSAGSLVLTVHADTALLQRELSAGVASAGAAASASLNRSLGSSLTSIGSKLTSTGRTLTRNLTLPIVGLGVVATKFAVDYASAFAKIDASTDASRTEFEKWRKEVLQLSGETAQAPIDLAEGLYFLASAGLRANQIMPVLEASAKGAAAGYGEVKDIAQITSSVLNAYADTAIKAADVTDILAAAVRVGRAEPDAFATALGRILPIASKADVSFAEIAASLASVSNIGLDVNEGVTAMRGLLQALVAPTQQSQDALKELGLSADDVRASLADDGLLATLDLLEEKSNGQIDVLQKLVPNVRALTGFFGLTEQEASKVAGALDEVTNSKGDMDKAFETTEKRDPMFKFKQAMADLQKLAINLGNRIIPILTETIIPAIQDIAKAFEGLSPEMKDFVIKGLAIAALAGPFLRIAGAVATLTGKLLAFAPALTGAGRAAAAGGAGKGGGLLASIGSGSGLAGAGIAAGAAIGTAGFANSAVSLNDLITWDTSEMSRGFVDDFMTDTIRAITVEKSGFWDQFLTTQGINDQVDEAIGVINQQAQKAIAQGADPAKVAGVIQANFAETQNAIGGVNEGTEGVRQVTRDILGLGHAAGLSATTLLEAGSAADHWTRILLNSGDAETNAGRKLAQLITGLEHTSDGMSDLTTNQVENLLAMGDTAGALALVRKAYDRAFARQGQWTEGTAKQREESNKASIAAKTQAGAMNNAGDAAQTAGGKVSTYSDYLHGIPPNVRTKVTADTAGAQSQVTALHNSLLALQQQTYTAFINVVQGGKAPGENAAGTSDWEGGVTMVGEKGPEMVFLPRHSQVIPNHRLGTVKEPGTARMVVLEGYVDVDSGRIRAIAREEVDDDHRFRAGLGRMR